MSNENLRFYKAKRALFVFLAVFFSINLSRGIWGLLQAEKHLTQVEQEVAALEAEKRALEEDYAYQVSPDFTEQQIREKLQMALPGEEVIIIPPGALPTMIPITPTPQPTSIPEYAWQQWRDVLLGGY